MNTKDNKEDTISKSLLLNWLSVSEKNIPVSDLGSWIEAKTNGKYNILKNEPKIDKD